MNVFVYKIKVYYNRGRSDLLKDSKFVYTYSIS